MPKRKIVTAALSDWTAADRAIARLCELERDRSRSENEMSRRVDAIREEYAPALADLSEEDAALRAQVEQFARLHRDEFGGKKSLERLQGVIGFRISPPSVRLLNRKWTWDGVLTALTRGFQKYIRSTPEVARDAILADYAAGAVSAEQLAGLGLQIAQSETFGIELKSEEAPTAPESAA